MQEKRLSEKALTLTNACSGKWWMRSEGMHYDRFLAEECVLVRTSGLHFYCGKDEVLQGLVKVNEYLSRLKNIRFETHVLDVTEDYCLLSKTITGRNEFKEEEKYRVSYYWKPVSDKNIKLYVIHIAKMDEGGVHKKTVELFDYDSKERRFIDSDNILYCEADGHMTSVYLTGKKMIRSGTIFKEVLKKLPETMIVISRGTAVNSVHIENYNHGTGELTMDNGQTFTVSVRRKTRVREAVNQL